MRFTGEQETSAIISPKSYLGTIIIGLIPLIGSIMLLRWSKDKNVRESKRNLCKAMIIVKYSLIIPLIIIAYILGYLLGKLT